MKGLNRIRFVLIALLGAATCQIGSVAANDHTGLDTALRVPLLPVACETALALSAAPHYLRDEAGVYVMEADGFRLSRAPRNPFTCIVNRDDPRVLKPTCFDAEGAETIVPKIRYVGARLLSGIPLDIVADELDAAFARGDFISPRRPGVAYMLSRYNRPVNRQTGVLGFFPPHVMFYAPNLTNADIGHDMRFHDPAQPLPMIAYGGPQGYMIMIADDGTPRTRSDLHPSCPDWVYAEPAP